jgi:hypothetical protein
MASGVGRKPATAEQRFSKLIEALSQDRRITQGGGKGFGSGALNVNGKIFAMLNSNNHFVVKLAKERVNELIGSGAGSRFEPRPGKPLKEWLVVTAAGADWAKLAKEACEFVRGGKS